MNSNVVSLPDRGSPVLTKAQLAKKLGCSTRTVELRMAEGMPALDRLDRWGRRLYDWRVVEAWLSQERPKRSVGSLEARVSEIERRLGIV